MVSVNKEGVLLAKTANEFESTGVLNPAIYQDGNNVHLFYRAVSFNNHSTIGYCQLEGPLTVIFRASKPLLEIEHDYESSGLEDPRIVKIDGTYYMTYTAYDGKNALGALAISTDLVHFEKKGIIVPHVTQGFFRKLIESDDKYNKKYLRFLPSHAQIEDEKNSFLIWDKNLVLFPRKINGQFVFLHRIRPDIQIVKVDELSDLTTEFWTTYLENIPNHVLLQSFYDHELSYVGGGCPPIETEHGWLIIYHGVCDSPKGFVYSACAALFDLEKPEVELSRLPYSLFSPDINYEQEGFVNDVCFPTGTAVFDGTLFIYYGAADEQIACASIGMERLLAELIHYVKQ